MRLMRVLLTVILMAFISGAYAYHDKHKPGHYFVKIDGVYYPDYQYPRFDYYWYTPDRLCHDRPKHNKTHVHGMLRCYNHEGLSREFYLR